MCDRVKYSNEAIGSSINPHPTGDPGMGIVFWANIRLRQQGNVESCWVDELGKYLW
jgi:hypothetical protein